MSKKKDIKEWTILIIGIAAIIMIAYIAFFKNETSQASTTSNTYIQTPTPTTIQQQYTDYQNSLSLTPNILCSGETTKGYINTNIQSGVCTIFTKTTSQWQIYKNINLDSSGDYSETASITQPGTAYFVAICCDSTGRCRTSNQATLTIKYCQENQPEPEPQDQADKCTDSDGGIVYNVKGTCSSDVSMTSTQDECSGSSTLKEKYCGTDGNCKIIEYSCTAGSICIMGTCQQPPCDYITPTRISDCSIGYCTETGKNCFYHEPTLIRPAYCGCEAWV